MASRALFSAVGLTVSLLAFNGCDDGIRPRHSPADSLATVRYVQLLRAELSADDAMAAYKAVQCEGHRLLRVYTQSRGNAYAMEVLEGAQERAYRNVSRSDVRRIDDRLPQVLPGYSDQDCAALARAGLLGDTVFPPAGEFKP